MGASPLLNAPLCHRSCCGILRDTLNRNTGAKGGRGVGLLMPPFPSRMETILFSFLYGSYASIKLFQKSFVTYSPVLITRHTILHQSITNIHHPPEAKQACAMSPVRFLDGRHWSETWLLSVPQIK